MDPRQDPPRAAPDVENRKSRGPEFSWQPTSCPPFIVRCTEPLTGELRFDWGPHPTVRLLSSKFKFGIWFEHFENNCSGAESKTKGVGGIFGLVAWVPSQFRVSGVPIRRYGS